MTVEPLRYPNAQIEDETDFLEIKVVKYEPPKFNKDEFKQGTSSESLAKNIETPLAYVFLPIPENIQDSNAVDWGSDSLNGVAARAIGVAASGIAQDGILGAMGAVASDAGAMVSGLEAAGVNGQKIQSFFAAKAVGALGFNVDAKAVISRASGQVLNPNMELLFNNVTLRSFNFEFDLAPRDKDESKTIKNMLRLFKKSMSAKKGGKDGIFISSPDVFKLCYKTGGQNHKFLHNFKPMALLNMSVNYTGSGTYATYDDTTPVHMKLSLSFQELNPVYAEDYDTEEGLIGVGY
tara:strand:+ start:1566 stop:2444 length:879 start_codon:yes stop_codon:yes gene_type:complete